MPQNFYRNVDRKLCDREEVLLCFLIFFIVQRIQKQLLHWLLYYKSLPADRTLYVSGGHVMSPYESDLHSRYPNKNFPVGLGVAVTRALACCSQVSKSITFKRTPEGLNSSDGRRP